eukprot:Gb_19919 [translate_table: standard]
MGGDPVTTEPVVLVVDEEVRNILEEAGFLTFFNKFKGHSEGVTRQFIDSWKEGRVSVDKSEFLVSASLIVEASGLPNEVLMAKSGKGKPPLHQGLMKMLVDFVSSKSSPAAGPSKGGFTKVSGTPITKAQLLLGPIPGGRKRKTPVQALSSSLAKCSMRSSRLQQKLGGKPSLLDVAEYSEEERVVEEPSPVGGKSCPIKGPAANPSENVESPSGPFMVILESSIV